MDGAAVFLDYSQRKLDQLAGRIEACLDLLTEDQVWARGGDHENAAGNLALHLSGNVRQWIVAGIGGAADTRQRDAEFAARGGLAKPELKRRLRETVDEACATLRAFPHERLTETLTIQTYRVTALEAIYHVVEHFSMHTGQIVFIAKMLTGADPGFYAHLSQAAGRPPKTP